MMEKTIKLHLGCGKRKLEGYLHIDSDYFPHLDYQSKLHELPMFKDNSIEVIYSSHALEYYDRSSVKEVLSEWNRILIPGGVCFVTVPNFDSLIEIYKTTGKLENILGPIYGKWPDNTNKTSVYHQTVWNKNDLIVTLQNLGFVNIFEFNPVSFLQKIDPNYDDHSLAFYPHFDQTGIQVSLAITFSKKN